MTSFRERMPTVNKHVVNPVLGKLAGLRHSPFAMIRHKGRRSGKRYETPIAVRRVRGGFMLALTYGPSVDWYRNIVAAGGGTLRWHAKEYVIGPPEVVAIDKGLRAFSPPEQFVLRRLHIQDFRRVSAQRVKPGR